MPPKFEIQHMKIYHEGKLIGEIGSDVKIPEFTATPIITVPKYVNRAWISCIVSLCIINGIPVKLKKNPKKLKFKIVGTIISNPEPEHKGIYSSVFDRWFCE